MDYVIKIDEQSGRELTDYQIRIEITDSDFFDKCTDQKFVEFYDEDKQTLLSHYTELFDTANKIAIFWVKVPSIQANGTKYIYLNINTSRTEDLSDPEAVFDFWDDFETLDKWRTIRIGGNGYAKAEDGYLKLYSTDARTAVDAPVTLKDVIVEAKVYVAKDNEWFGIVLSQGEYNDAGEEIDGYDAGWNGWPSESDRQRLRKWVGGSATELAKTSQGLLHNGETHILGFKFASPDLAQINDGTTILTAQDSTFNQLSYLGLAVWSSGEYWVDWVRVRKFTDPEPSVTVIKLGATPTYELKLKIAQALAGETTTILDTDPKLRLLSGTDIIKELSLTAKTVYKDSTNNRVVVAFLFVDDSSDSYTTDNQELLFTKDNTEYVAFKSSKSFTKVADKRLPLRWEIYLNYDVDVCTYEESMVTCL